MEVLSLPEGKYASEAAGLSQPASARKGPGSVCFEGDTWNPGEVSVPTEQMGMVMSRGRSDQEVDGSNRLPLSRTIPAHPGGFHGNGFCDLKDFKLRNKFECLGKAFPPKMESADKKFRQGGR